MLKHNQTICYKVDRCIEKIESTIKTGEFDAPGLAKLLHEIRRDGQKMEDGLRKRKKIMESVGVESVYQTAKGNVKPKGINKIPNEAYAVNDNPQYEITIKNGDEILYQNLVESGVMCAVEEMEGMDEQGNVNGQTQTFVFGKTVGWWFAFDQLRQSIEARGIEIMSALREMARNNKLIDVEVRDKLLGKK